MTSTNSQSEPNSASQEAAEPSPAEAKLAVQAAAMRQARMAQAFSQIIAVFMRDANFRNLRLADLEWLAIAPIMAGQFKLGSSQFESDKKQGGVTVPVAVALWARVSDAVDERLSENLEGQIQLQANEWASGDHLWLIAAAGDPRAIGPFLKTLSETEFAGQQVKLRVRGADGKGEIKTLADYAPASGDADDGAQPDS